MLIKICGVTDQAIATQCGVMGADFVGLLFHPASPRYVTLTDAIHLSAAIVAGHAQPVAVFVDQTAEEMLEICEKTGINVVQLHGDSARKHHHLLPNDITRIYALTVSLEGEVLLDEGVQYLDPVRDYILIDHPTPGQGKRLQAVHLPDNFTYRWIVAGGLTPENVIEVENSQPSGVDVSSGVEICRGKKDLELIKKFIQAVRRKQDE
jgi:phosphoribosylanthranilate isomerase